MKSLFSIMVLAALLGAGPASRPSTTQTARDPVPALRAKVVAAEDDVVRAKKDAVAKIHATADYRALADEVEAKRKALEQARAGTDAKAKLDASAAYNAARLKLERMDAAAADDPAIRDAEAKVKTAERELAEGIKARDAADPIGLAQREGRPAVGMTLDQAKAAVGDAGTIERETEDAKLYRFSQNKGFRTWWCWVRDGKLIEVTKDDVVPRPSGPTTPRRPQDR